MLEIGSLVGEYRIEKLVGQGGMGQVYGAVHPLIGKRAAIKVLRGELCADPEAIDRFILEARAVNQIGHPNIVDVFAFGSLPDGRQYMVMEWLRGESLDERIRRMLPTLEETCEIMLSICAALDAAHAEQIVHRDLKPHNVFMSHARGMKPAVKLLDFGLVKLVGEHQVERTRSGSMLGTPAYMSPEQARGRGVDHRTDLYALGVMLFELVTGTLPFIEQSAMEMVMAHLQAQPPVPSAIRPGLPPAIDQVVLGLLEKDPAYRPTISQLIGVLADVQKLAASAPGALTPTLIATHPMPGSPHTPTLVSGNLPPSHAPPIPASEQATQRPGQLPRGHAPPAMPGLQVAAMSTPIPMMAPSVVPPSLATGSVPAPQLAHASVAHVPASTSVSTAPVTPAPNRGRRVLLAILATLAASGLAFGIVMAMRGGEVAPPDAAVPIATPSPDAAVGTAMTVRADAMALAPSDAAIAPPVAVEPPVVVDAPVATKRTRDAGVARSRDASTVDAAVTVAAPDAGVAPDAAVKPIDDGDGLLPSKGRSR